MVQAKVASAIRPVVGFLKRSDAGNPYLEGHRCGNCEAVFLGERSACAKCGARGQIAAFELATTGHLYVYSIVHRSLPGVKGPILSAVVDLDGGGTLKGDLIHVEPDTETIQLGMPVEVVFGEAQDPEDRTGSPYLTYSIQPASRDERSPE